jgi:hypothetical protein
MSTFGQAEREEFRSNRRSLNLNLSASASCFGVLPYLLKRLSWPPCGLRAFGLRFLVIGVGFLGNLLRLGGSWDALIGR